MTLLIAAVAAISWLVVGIDWATGEWSNKWVPSMPDPKFLLFAALLTGVLIYAGNLGGKKSMRTVATVLAAVWLAAGIGWWAGEWSGILVITAPSLIILIASLLALPPFVLPVAPQYWQVPAAIANVFWKKPDAVYVARWKVSAAGAMLYTLLWLASLWGGWLELNAISMWVYWQGWLLIFRPAIPIESIRESIAAMLLLAYGLIAFAIYRSLDAFDPNSLNLFILVQGILVISCYILSVMNKNKAWTTWVALAILYGVGFLVAISRGRIDATLTNGFILLLGLVAFLRFILPDKDKIDRQITWGMVFVIFIGYALVWTMGLTTQELTVDWFGFLTAIIGLTAIFMPLGIRPAENWEAFKALITYNLGRNYPYYAVAAEVDEPSRLSKRADGNSFAKLLAGPGITLSNADHIFVVWDGPGFGPERQSSPGLTFTHIYEDVQEAVDLRFQLRARPAVRVKTKDGIDVSVVTFTPFRLAIDRAVAVTPDGRHAIVAYHTGALKVWNLEAWNKEHTLVGHTDWARAVAMTTLQGDLRAVSTSSDGTLKVWDPVTGQQLTSLDGYAKVRAIDITADTLDAILGFSDGTIEFLNLKTGAKQSLASHKDWVCAVAATPDGRRAISASSDTTLKVWNLRARQEIRTLAGRVDWVDAMSITPDGRYALSASPDGALRIWDLDKDQECTFADGQRGVRAVATRPDGERAIFVFSNGEFKEWTIPTEQQQQTCREGHRLQPVRAWKGVSKWKRLVGNPAAELGYSLPYDPEAVFKAVRGQQMMRREQGEKSGWDALVRQRCKAVMRDIIAGYTVDELCSLYDRDRDPRVEIATKMRDRVRSQTKKWGLELIGGGISNLVPLKEVIQKRVEHWQAGLQREIIEIEAQEEAQERIAIQTARIEAEHDLINSIRAVYDDLNRLTLDQRKQLIALRLLEAVEWPKVGPQDSASEDKPAPQPSDERGKRS